MMNTLAQGAMAYAAMGVIALVICRLIGWFHQRRKKDSFIRDLMKAMERPIPRYMAALKTAGMWLVALVVWPLAVGIVAWDLTARFRRPQHTAPKIRPQDMFYAKDNLIEEVTIAQAEAREHHVDPLGLVPALPFGHLHQGWKAFLARKPNAEATLWAFHRKVDDESVRTFYRAHGTARGYCWVVNGNIAAEIAVES